MRYEHISWFFHDLSHIMNDVSGMCEINVYHYSEYTAIYNSFEQCKELGIEIPEELRELISLYNARFNSKRGYDFEQFFESQEEDGEEEDEEE